MFERYAQKARRAVFFARYEASQFGSPQIESEHLLVGLLRENKNIISRFLQPANAGEAWENIRKQIEEHTIIREKVSTTEQGRLVLRVSLGSAVVAQHGSDRDLSNLASSDTVPLC